MGAGSDEIGSAVEASRGVRHCGQACIRCMKRKLFNLAAALSLLLCVAVCVLWVRSYRVADGIIRQSSAQSGIGSQWTWSSSGWFSAGFGRFNSRSRMRLGPNGFHLEHRSPPQIALPRGTLARRLGFGCERQGFWGVYSGWMAWAPHWAIAILAGLPAALWLIANRRAARRLKGRGFAVEQVTTEKGSLLSCQK